MWSSPPIWEEFKDDSILNFLFFSLCLESRVGADFSKDRVWCWEEVERRRWVWYGGFSWVGAKLCMVFFVLLVQVVKPNTTKICLFLGVLRRGIGCDYKLFSWNHKLASCDELWSIYPSMFITSFLESCVGADLFKDRIWCLGRSWKKEMGLIWRVFLSGGQSWRLWECILRFWWRLYQRELWWRKQWHQMLWWGTWQCQRLLSPCNLLMGFNFVSCRWNSFGVFCFLYMWWVRIGFDIVQILLIKALSSCPMMVWLLHLLYVEFFS